MGVETFTVEEFMAALPRHKVTNKPLWKDEGYVYSERCFLIKVRPDVFIAIRSSIRKDGTSAPSGKDSIRAWIVGPDGRPIGNKLKSHTTRMKGWQRRLTLLLRELFTLGKNLANCPDCGKAMGIFIVKKEGRNKGRKFAKCFKHGHFTWVSVPVKNVVDHNKILPWTEEEMLDSLAGCSYIKDRKKLIREGIYTNDGIMAYCLIYIYQQQTYEERLTKTTRVDNKVGFSGVDAELLTSFAEQLQAKGWLSYKQLKYARKKVAKYTGQVERYLRPLLEAA
jgi:hypothetical protein